MQYSYEDALRQLLATKRNLLITGPGGTGKTTLIKDYMEKTDEKVILCATIGTAAVNIGGETCHRVFTIPVPAYGVRVTSKQDRSVSTVSKADCIVIDEISMCTNDVFSFMYRVIKKAENEKGAKIRLVVVGDFLQLPPVVTKTSAKMLKKCGLDESGWCFACKEWAEAKFLPVELTEIKRQSEGDYIKHLNQLRVGDISDIEWFSSHVVDEFSIPTDCIYICGTNAEADRVNNARLSELGSAFSAYQAEKHGRVSSPPADNIVALKPGERVIFTVNSNEPGVYQNGLMGTVTNCYTDNVRVMSDDGRSITVRPHLWHIYSYKVTGGMLDKHEVGDFSQIPLKPAYAITIHKSQGKTFDRAVISPESFAPGQLYVALSRVKSSDGLYLTKELDPAYVKADPVSEKFVEDGYTYELPKKKVPAVKKMAVKKAASEKTKKRKTSAAGKKTSAGTRKPASKRKTTRTTAKKITAGERRPSAGKSAASGTGRKRTAKKTR